VLKYISAGVAILMQTFKNFSTKSKLVAEKKKILMNIFKPGLRGGGRSIDRLGWDPEG
jgi:hypothetical protein